MTPADRTVAHLRVAAEQAAQHHAARIGRSVERVNRWLRQRDAYSTAHRVLSPHDPRQQRAAVLAEWAAHRAMAWNGLARGDAETARAHRRHAARCFTAAHAIRIA